MEDDEDDAMDGGVQAGGFNKSKAPKGAAQSSDPNDPHVLMLPYGN